MILVSTQEIAQRLGVKHQTVHTWRARGILPEPDFDLGVGPVWLWETIREWAVSTGRLRPGQHRHTTTPAADQQDSP